MHKWITRLITRIERRSGASGRQKCHRRILLLSPVEGAVDQLFSQWLATTDGETKLLHSETGEEWATNISAVNEDGRLQSNALVVDATYIDASSARRLRRWQIELPSHNCLAVGKGDDALSKADTCIVAWPYEQLSVSESGIQRRLDQILAIVGACRSRSRVRRLAVVITGVPDSEWLRHASQQRLDIEGKMGVAASLRMQLAQSVGRPGHPLADPRWRSFVADKILNSRGLLRLTETCRAALRADCPIFLMPITTSPAVSDLVLLKWINKSTPAPVYDVPRVTRVAPAIAFILTLAAAYLWISAPGAAQGRIKDGKELESVSSNVEGDLEMYSNWRSRWFLPSAEIAQHTGELREAKEALDVYHSLNQLYQERDSLAGQLVSVELKALSSVSEFAQGTLLPSLRRTLAAIRDTNLARLALQAGFPIEFSLRLLGLGSMGLTRTDQYDSVFSSEWLTDTTIISPGAADGGVYTSSPGEFYLRLLTLYENETRLPFSGFSARSLVWRDFTDSLLAIVPRLEPSAVVAHKYRQLLRVTRDGHLFATKDLSTVSRLERAIDDVYAPHPMVITFKIPGDQSFHVDVSESPSGPWRPSQWIGDQCTAQLPAARVGDLFYLICNAGEAIHVTTSRSGRPCVTRQPTVVRLLNRSGRIDFEGDHVEVQFEINEGWPEWPPQSSGG